MIALTIREHGDRVSFPVRVQPRARASEVDGVHDGALRVRLTAPPVSDPANDALVMVLADALQVGRSAVRIVTGHRSRRKIVEVHGIAGERVRRLSGER